MQRMRRDPRPIDESCNCYTCQHFSRAYLRHLITAKEMLSSTLLSIHNLHTLLQMRAELRQAVLRRQHPGICAPVLRDIRLAQTELKHSELQHIED